MFLEECVLSIWTLITIRLIGKGHKYGPPSGVICNVCWCVMWIHTKQYGFLIADTGLFVLYCEMVWSRRKTKELMGSINEISSNR